MRTFSSNTAWLLFRKVSIRVSKSSIRSRDLISLTSNFIVSLTVYNATQVTIKRLTLDAHLLFLYLSLVMHSLLLSFFLYTKNLVLHVYDVLFELIVLLG